MFYYEKKVTLHQLKEAGYVEDTHLLDFDLRDFMPIAKQY